YFGNSDKLLRILLAGVLIGLNLGGVISGTLGIVSLSLAGVFVLTSTVSFCPLYVAFGFKTCKVNS
ncbi:MAG: DUF2892 domain-containing protein, partial [Crocinitomicaceae bacterium]